MIDVLKLQAGRVAIVGLSKCERLLLHGECENIKFFHWSEKIDAVESKYFVFNLNADKQLSDISH